MLDAGDALSPNHIIDDQSRPRWEATAELIVQQYGAQGVDALGISDRDLALGKAVLTKLAANGKVPFVATNLVDTSGKPVFQPWLAVERAGLRILVLALVGESAGRMARGSLEREGWVFRPVGQAARDAIAAQPRKPDVVVVLSQLSPPEQATLGVEVPEIRLFLGGDSMGMSSELASVGSALAADGGQKGKYVGFLTVTFDDPAGPSRPYSDPNRRAGLEARKASAERRVQNYERLIAQAKATSPVPPGTPATTPPPVSNGPPTPVRPPPVEAYERQLASARAELQLTTNELETLDEGSKTANHASFELIPMEAKVADEPVTKAAVDAFRKLWPDPTKPAQAPQPVPPGTPPGAPVGPPPLPH